MPSAHPTPIPAFAPVLRPDDGSESDLDVPLADAGSVTTGWAAAEADAEPVRENETGVPDV